MGEYREIKAELKHSLPNGWHTPNWSQARMPSGHPIGCGPTAWTILYGYWRAFKAKNNLFDGYDIVHNCEPRNSNDEQIVKVMGQISQDTKTDYGGESTGDRFGLTWPRNMCKGSKYAKGKGYRNTSCDRIRGSEFSKFDKIKSELDADNPVILLIKEGKSRGIPNHYVVIEAAIKKQKRVLRKWRDRDVKYLVNFGHDAYAKNKRDWIYVREVGRNTHKIWTAASAFTVHIN